MSAWLVEIKTQGREVYAVDAESKLDAENHWPEGHLIVSEVLDSELVSAAEDDGAAA